MARRKNTSPADDIIDLVALLPWYMGVVMAVAGYLVLHRSVIAPMATLLKPGDVSAAMTGAVWRGLAGVGQYVVPAICLAGGAVSAWRRRTRHALVENVTRSEAPGMLDNMSWREFVMLVGEGFRLQGYSVAETSSRVLMKSSISGCARTERHTWCNASSGGLSRWECPSCVSCMA